MADASGPKCCELLLGGFSIVSLPSLTTYGLIPKQHMIIREVKLDPFSLLLIPSNVFITFEIDAWLHTVAHRALVITQVSS